MSLGMCLTSINNIWRVAMSEQVKKGLEKLWQSEPVTYTGFSYVKQVEVEKHLEKVPARFDKKPVFMLKQASKDSTASKKSHVSKDIEQSESDKLLCLNSGDNEKAECLATCIEDHHKRNIDWVSLQFISNVEQTPTHIDNYIYLNTYPV